jgi:dihydrofolate reductase
MGRIVISENVTLDLVTQDPAGDEGFALGGWNNRISDEDRAGFAAFFAAEADSASALLMGRRSYEWFAARWVSRTGAWAERLASLPKYVVSSKPVESSWGVTAVVQPDSVAGLRQRVDGEIVVNASRKLVNTLVELGLVDEVRLLVHPFALGAGDRLTVPSSLRLAGNRRIGESLVALTYTVAA